MPLNFLLENVALKGTVTQSSTYLNTWVAQRAIDGVRHKDTYCSITLSEMNSWWRLDLLSEYEIGTVIITNRDNGWAEQTSGAEIRIGNSMENNGNNNPICVVIPNLQAGTSIIFSFNGTVGRYVNVVMPTVQHLSLCEVEVYGTGNKTVK
ncbi:Fucolectin-1 Precursor [Triplophysa tibetana]|uniref:Fucolectin-1 n=1 Tax=Triplophysa tibetana TaxID=1572043 RepID=A0A5A9PMF2_9TELE|nr:Fucolectin-1 Precursor [Triplophysa tibetana]